MVKRLTGVLTSSHSPTKAGMRCRLAYLAIRWDVEFADFPKASAKDFYDKVIEDTIIPKVGY